MDAFRTAEQLGCPGAAGQVRRQADNAQTMEVAVARVYNWDVVQKRKEKAEGGGEQEKEEKD